MKITRVLLIALFVAACDGGVPEDTETDTSAAPDSVLSPQPTTTDTPTARAPMTTDPVVAAWVARVDSTVFIRWGACPFECCVYRDWVAEAPVIVRTEPDSSAPVVVTLRVGERFAADTGFVRITSAQLVIVTEPVEAYRVSARPEGGEPHTLAVGDTVLVLEHQGEGHFLVTDGQTMYSAPQFWPGEDGWEPYGGAKGTVLGRHGAEWWAYVWTAGGQSGWIDAYRSELGNVDACGVPA